jgi:hypothetical protein
MRGESRRLGRVLDAEEQIEATRLGGRGEHPLGQAPARDDGRPGARVAQDMRVVRDRVGGVGRDRDGADRHRRRVGDREFRPVFADQKHAVARRDPTAAQERGDRGNGGRESGPARPVPGAAAPVAQHRAIRPLPGEAQHHGRQARPFLLLVRHHQDPSAPPGLVPLPCAALGRHRARLIWAA